ncbi:hypothetical protein LAJ19_02015 [Deinococcus taeanensis]|uniref:hypothetical protein n=1 Tax=Deinococcus taeanensis TaxID=2737050 RepID=UPI001CDC8005|nr:hypothetical protein [Deinococcus taeanensis]UBV43023.1 hypothetical protein LAJ19_02015 [Deinococcus taeanensis]
MTQPTPTQFDTITLKGSQLYATRKGKDYPLFVYTPLAQSYAGRYEVPLGAEWPQYNRAFVQQYVPVYAQFTGQLPAGLTFSTQERPNDPWYGYQQLLCNGWPLYYVEHLHQGAKTEQPALFEPATQGMTPPSGPDEPVVTWPPVYLGP